ncbi:MAG: DUF3368 domain-containing protein [Bacteroidales bacterium]|nr:DUF3368 domain-containing protein [Bacteroidales bacterium]
MKLIIADTGAIISLGLAGKIELITKVFSEFYIAGAVYEELIKYENPNFDSTIRTDLKSRVVEIKSKNFLSMIMDYGESEYVILYEELKADYLLIDDGKARKVAESLNVNCIGSIGLLIRAKQKGFLDELKPIFENWISNDRYFSKHLLNKILIQTGESPIFEK